MNLYDNIQSEIKKAMKEKNHVKLNTLRAIVASVKNYLASSAEARNKGITDELVQNIVLKEAKKREESIAAYKNAGRNELAASEEAELNILKEFMPKMLSENEIRELAIEIIDSMGAAKPSDLGKVMKELMPRVKGKADGKIVNRIVRELLESR
ncbi:MAG: GatB/YqeY domain-containing protein [Thermotogae bacterium]|uniref:GatB/YqeY domain-containing protein n=1 Tax=Kosmotoga arenicorallina TaxID=688066 RepID=A0A7C5I0X8_9BACT|nr:GatB/YqeY domain-containing protein [Kosmotoga sp.]MBO8166602.1 GatB/YqeY domain-containing protein [Kosmotoga sp.]MCD6160124.1 GatB/YqeY domain-containing protein [Kosmotoga sp.]RKX49239.1 MAG: GatB/YqeY domain-containing protein [Thermotogota bacterium]HHF08530.1 GatB/YqeY domain-containing protein [Kosmotoga arenicorallina]